MSIAEAVLGDYASIAGGSISGLYHMSMHDGQHPRGPRKRWVVALAALCGVNAVTSLVIALVNHDLRHAWLGIGFGLEGAYFYFAPGLRRLD